MSDKKVIELVGQPVTYTSGIPEQSSATAFVTAVNQEQESVDLLVLDEAKKNLLGGPNWWMAFRRFHDVPHASEESERHGFEFLNAVPALEKPFDPADPPEPAEPAEPITEGVGPALVAAPEKFNDNPSSDPETRAEEAQDEVDDAVAEQKAEDAAADAAHPRKKKKVSG